MIYLRVVLFVALILVSPTRSLFADHSYCPQFLTRDLGMLSEGSDVKELQLFLNSDAATRIAPYGIASPGQETEKFGYATQDAVKRFQTAAELPITGRVTLPDRLFIKLLCNSLIAKDKTISTPQPSEYSVIQQSETPTSNIEVVSRSVGNIPLSSNVLAGYEVLPDGSLQLTVGSDTSEYMQLALETLHRIPDFVQSTYLTRIVITNTLPSNAPNLLAAVTPIADDKFVLTIYKDNYLSQPESEKALTIAHELSHIVSMNSSQYTQATSSCGTYIDINNNCYTDTSALYKFYNTFWNGAVGKQTFVDSKYITPYATESASEDFAESFAYFTLKEVYNFPQLSVMRIVQSPRVVQKLDFFLNFPKLVELKRLILVNFVSWH